MTDWRAETLLNALSRSGRVGLTQLYFDRRRALLALDSQPDKQTPEAELLRLRAEELAAGLDAWTGGWFSAALGAEADSSAGCSPLLNTVPTPGNEDRS